METFITNVIIIIITVAIFKLIKSVCKPIKNITAILLIIPTVATCGIALIAYKFLRSSIYDYSVSPSSSSSKTYDNIYYDNELSNKSKEVKKKKVARSMEVSGKTAYYDEEGNYMGTSIDNGFGKQVFTDEEGNYVGEGFNNGFGQTTYTDKDGNVTTSNTNYLGDEVFSDGTIAKNDTFGNKNYH